MDRTGNTKFHRPFEETVIAGLIDSTVVKYSTVVAAVSFQLRVEQSCSVLSSQA